MINVRNIIHDCKSKTRQDIAFVNSNILKLKYEYSDGLLPEDEYNNNLNILNKQLTDLKAEITLLNQGIETDTVRNIKKEKEYKIKQKQEISLQKKKDKLNDKQKLNRQLDIFYKKEKSIAAEY